MDNAPRGSLDQPLPSQEKSSFTTLPKEESNAQTPKKPVGPEPTWSESFHSIVNKIGATTDHPELADLELTQLALRLKSEELNDIYLIATANESSGDERLLATELLIRSQLPESIDSLKKIASMNIEENTAKTPALRQEYRSQQMMAIEGLGQKPEWKVQATKALNDLARTETDSMNLDRIHRTRRAMEGQAPTPEAQDNEALKKVLNTRKK